MAAVESRPGTTWAWPCRWLVLRLLLAAWISSFARGFLIGFSVVPGDVVALPGTTAILTCGTNVTADKISWQHNHNFLHADSPSFNVSQTADGLSQLVLAVSSNRELMREQVGLYQCVAWFGAIALTSLPGHLRVADLSSFQGSSSSSSDGISSLRAVSVLEGDPVVLSCSPPPSVPPAVITFTKDGYPLDANHSQDYYLTASGDLYMASVGPWDEGTYGCTARNPVLDEEVIAPFSTRLRLRPRVQNTPESAPKFLAASSAKLMPAAGSDVLVPCLVSGHPRPKIHWSRYGGQLPEGAQMKDSGYLELSSVSPADEGTYVCHVDNGVGRNSSTQVAVEVHVAPEVIKGPLEQTVEEGSSVTLQCQVRGKPKPEVIWVFNGELVRSDGIIFIKEDGLRISQVKKQHAGIFQCFGSNPLGTAQKEAMLAVRPTIITAHPGDTSIVHQDTTLSRGRGRGFRGNGDKENGEDGRRRKGGRGRKRGRKPNRGRGRGRGMRKKITVNLGEGGEKEEKKEGRREGEVICNPDGGFGGRAWKNKGVMIPPSRPNVTKMSDEAVMVTWTAESTPSLPICFYKIQYKELGVRGKNLWMTIDEDIPAHITSYEVTDLKPHHGYKFRIAAVYANNDSELGPTSAKFLLEKDVTMQRPLYPPIMTNITQIEPTKVFLEWNYNATPGVPVEGFIIHYRQSTSAGDYVKVTLLGSNKRSYVISHLLADVAYDFKIHCFNLAGTSEFSDIISNRKKSPEIFSSVEVTTSLTPVPSDSSITRDDYTSLSNIHLYIVLGAVLGILLLIVLISFIAYSCKNKNLQEIPCSPKYEDTSLHIHRAAVTYSLPGTPLVNGHGPNGYMPHRAVALTPAALHSNDNKITTECAHVDNNNHQIQELQSFCPSAERSHIPQEETVSLNKEEHNCNNSVDCTQEPLRSSCSAEEKQNHSVSLMRKRYSDSSESEVNL